MYIITSYVTSHVLDGNRLATRTKRVAAKSIAAIPAESIPFIGVAVLIADTGYELYAACETVKDLDQLYSDLGMADDTPDDVLHSVYDPELPNSAHIWVDLGTTCKSRQPKNEPGFCNN
jgi:hypothetical protein